MKPSGRSWLNAIIVCLALGWVVAAPLRGGSLARLVPDDVGLCLELNGLSGAVEAIVDSPLYRRALDVPPLSYLTTAADIDRLRKIVTLMSQTMRVEPEVLWRQVFGDQVVFGVWPGDMGAPDSQSGVLLVEAADSRILVQLVAAVAHARRQGETEVQVKLLSHAGAKYWSRVGSHEGRQTAVFLAAAGRVGVVTANESLMRRVLELAAAGEAPQGSLAALPGYRLSQTQLSSEAPWRVFFNPRPWDSQMPTPPVLLFDELPASAQLARQALADVWRSTEYWVAAIRMEPPLRIESRWQFDRSRLPAPLAGLLTSLEGPAQMLDRVPVDATLAVGGYFDFQKFVAALGPAAGAEADQARRWIRESFWGWDLLAPLVGGLRPQVAMYLAPSQSDRPDQPLDWAVRVELPESPAAGEGSAQVGELLDQALESALRLAGQAAPRGEGQGPRGLEIIEREGVTLKSLGLDGPGGAPWNVSYSVTPQALVAGSGPEAVLRCAQLEPDRSLATSPVFTRLADPRLPQPSHYLYLDCQRLRQMVNQQHGEVLRMLTARRGLNDPAAEQVIAQMADLLQSLDRVLISARFDASGASFSVGADLPEAGSEPTTGNPPPSEPAGTPAPAKP